MASILPGHPLAAFDRFGPDRAATPLVVAVPHAGRYYPPAIERDRAVGRAVLEQLEDRYADRLIEPLVAAGAVCFVAQVARAWIDLNRAETDLAGAVQGESVRARVGLGLVPTRVGGRLLWRAMPAAGDVLERIGSLHRPYHAALAHALAAAHAAHGFAVLIDCHSMPPIGRGRGSPRIVVGDRYGASAALSVSEAALAAAAATGLPVARNAPYAGAYTIEQHGRPRQDVHALQIEIDRSLYLDPDSGETLPGGVAAVRALIASIAWAAVTAAGGSPASIAAE